MQTIKKIIIKIIIIYQSEIKNHQIKKEDQYIVKIKIQTTIITMIIKDISTRPPGLKRKPITASEASSKASTNSEKSTPEKNHGN